MNPWQLKQAVRYLDRGGVIAYPTEAVYGLGCDPVDAQAVMRLLRIKHRDVAKGLIIIAATMRQLDPFIEPPTTTICRRLEFSWPGPVTWLLTPRAPTPYWLTGEHPNIAARITEHPIARALCLAAGHALVSTSANLSRRQPARSALSVHRMFHGQVDFVLHGSLGGEKQPTEIRDAQSGQAVRPAYSQPSKGG